MKQSFRFIALSTAALATFMSSSAMAQTVPNSARPDVFERQNRIETPRP
jgi:hypothetical protein